MGSLKISRTIRISVPQGVEDGTRLRAAGEGEGGRNGGSPGDLYIVISVSKHPLFTRNGKDLRCEVAIDLVQAVQGGVAEVPTLTGRVEMKVPPGTLSGKVLILKGQGMPILQGSVRGDLKVKIRVEIPARPNKREKQLLNELDRLREKSPGVQA